MIEAHAAVVSLERDVSSKVPDWSREAVGRLEWNPSRQLLRAIREYQAASGPAAPVVRRKAVLAHRFWSVVTGADISIDSSLGGGLLMPHPAGIVVHPGSRVGPNCMLFQQVTLGSGARPGLPQIGGHVDIGAGAKVLGGIEVGAHVRIGANSVVLDDVPEGVTVAGIPARIIGSTKGS